MSASNQGAPLRVYSAVKLGYKNVKHLTEVNFLPNRTGGHWEDQGYDWFAVVLSKTAGLSARREAAIIPADDSWASTEPFGFLEGGEVTCRRSPLRVSTNRGPRRDCMDGSACPINPPRFVRNGRTI
jgi:hypothetical protein